MLADVPVDDNSYRYRAVKGANEVNLNFSLAEPIDIPLGSYIMYGGIRYTLEEPPAITKRDSRNIAYKAVFSAPQATLNRYRFRNTVDGRLKFSLTAKPHEHLQMLIDNLNLREKGWTAGDCIDDVEKVVNYDYSTCFEALDMMASEFDTEWEVEDRCISLKKVEYFKDKPLPLSYGKGNGFVSGVGRQNRSDEDSGLEILYAIGGDRNITPEQNTGGEKTGSPFPSIRPEFVDPPVSEVIPGVPMTKTAVKAAPVPAAEIPNPAMGNSNLILPRNQELEYEGEVYATDKQGYYVYKKNKPFTSRKEGALDCSDIYPKRVGEITDVFVADEEEHFYDFTDTSIPEDLDYEKCLIEGEKMTVIFQDGMLAGKEFDVKYYHHGRRFEIVPQEIDGVTMPDAKTGFVPVQGGKYAVFNVRMPDAYVCDNATQSGASWEMFRKAVEYLHDHADYLFTFNGTLDGIWAKRHWEEIKDRLVLGGMISFSDAQFQPNGVRIRIVGIKDYINDPHRPELELSNETVGQTVSGRIAQLETQEVAVEESARAGRQYTKRTFRDAKETMQALNEALDTFKGEFTEGISPITVNTMQMLVGSEQCQFEFVDNNMAVIDPELNYSETERKFSIKECYLRYLYGDTMSPEATFVAGKVAAGTSEELDRDIPYYVYLRGAVKAGADRTFNLVLSTTAKEFDEGNFRYLLMGILDKEMYGNRSWCPLYGYTEITPGRIRVNKIISTDGKTYFDLANNEIGGRINFKDGLVSGLIGVAGSTGAMKAGMNGEGNADDAIRFWAGADEANMINAPFQVYQNGHVVMSDAEIEGFIRAKQTVINLQNYQQYITDDGAGGKIFDYTKLKSNVLFDASLNDVLEEDNEIAASFFFKEDIEDNKEFIGRIVTIRNETKAAIGFVGFIIMSEGSRDGQSPFINTGETIIFKGTSSVRSDSTKSAMAWLVLAFYDKNGNNRKPLT